MNMSQQAERRRLTARFWLCGWLLIVGPATADDTPTTVTPRRAATESEQRDWLENMVRFHRFSVEEAAAATGMTVAEVEAATERWGIRPEAPLALPADQLLMLPYPGGRHPRIGFLDGAIDPQRETKVSVFTPWQTADAASYVVIDCPEAVWSNLGLTYLAHTHVPTIWTRQEIALASQEWEQPQPGVLSSTRRLPNGIEFRTHVMAQKDHVNLTMQLTNGTAEKLTDLRVQMCVMLKGAPGFDAQTNDNKQAIGPYACVRNDAGDRWIISAWKPNHRTWFNPPCPCLHSDPKFPDCDPGQTQELRGWLSFYAGQDVAAEVARIETLNWWQTAAASAAALEHIAVSADQRSFVKQPSGDRIIPWGFNYDHNRTGQLLEDYWETEWDTVVSDFQEMRSLGANTARIHLQFGKFMESPEQPRAEALARLAKLLDLAESTGLYLDLTGLGCYHKQDVPAWYDALSEADRWAAQAKFWSAVAECCAGSHAVFCYDLMNEPVVPAGQRTTDWLGPAFGDKHFVQRIGLDLAGRERPQVAREWIRTLVAAIRQHDPQHLVTVGLVPWSLKRPGLQSGFEPDAIAPELDFISVHLYPESGQLAADLETLQGFDVGKPVVIEETFPLKCSPEEFREFLTRSQGVASGWIGFYWGATPDEYATENTIPAAITRQWLLLFEELGPAMHAAQPKPSAK